MTTAKYEAAPSPTIKSPTEAVTFDPIAKSSPNFRRKSRPVQNTKVKVLLLSKIQAQMGNKKEAEASKRVDLFMRQMTLASAKWN